MHSALNPASPQARAIAQLWWWLFGAGAVIWVSVIVVMLIAVLKRGNFDRAIAERSIRIAVFGTVLVLAAVLAYDFTAERALAAHPSRALTIDVTGQQWWWQVAYENPDPSQLVTTANEIHVPVGEPVQLKLSSADVIHSLWVPSVNSKRDLVPGYKTTLWFTADTAGVYRGQCAEFCGLQHARMGLYIIAEPPEKFAQWLSAQRAPSAVPTDSVTRSGQAVFMYRGCALCHAIAGTSANGTVGPNLTHLKSRLSIASASLPNTKSNVSGWVVDPQALKPGTRMPAIRLSPNELIALVAYLETLK